MTIEVFFIFALSTILVVLCALPPLRELMAGRFDPMDPRALFLAYYALQMAIYPVYVLTSGREFKLYDKGAVEDLRLIVTASVVSILGLLAFLAGDLFARKARILRTAGPVYVLSERAVALLMAIGIPFAMYGIYSMYLSGGGIGGYIDSFVETRYGGTGRGYMSFIATSFVSVLAVLAFVASLRSRVSRWWRLIAYGLFFVSVVSAGLSGFRATMIPIMIAALMCIHYYVKRFTVFGTLILFAGLILFATGYAVVRAQLEARSAAMELDSMGRVTMADGFLARSPGIEMVATTIEGIRRNPDYAFFYPALFESATILVPRGIWPAKPVPQSIQYGEQFMNYFLFLRDGYEGANTGGISPTVIGYLYWQLGGVAVLVGMFLLGLIFGYSYRRFVERPLCQATATIYIVCGSIMAKFAEAPQDTMNAIVILGAFVLAALFASASGLRSNTVEPRPSAVHG